MPRYSLDLIGYPTTESALPLAMRASATSRRGPRSPSGNSRSLANPFLDVVAVGGDGPERPRHGVAILSVRAGHRERHSHADEPEGDGEPPPGEVLPGGRRSARGRRHRRAAPGRERLRRDGPLTSIRATWRDHGSVHHEPQYP